MKYKLQAWKGTELVHEKEFADGTALQTLSATMVKWWQDGYFVKCYAQK